MQPPWSPEAAVPAYLTPGPDETDVSSVESFRQVFQDPEWKTNVLLALVLMMIPIVGPIALGGWMCEAHQRFIRKHPRPIPKIDFSDFGDYIKRGLPTFLSGLLIGIPIYLLSYVFIGGAVIAGVVVANVTGEPLAGAAVGLLACLIAMLVMIAFSAVLNAVHTRAELTEEFSLAIKLGDVMAYTKRTFGKWLWKSISFTFLTFGVVIIGMLMCYIGLYPAIAVLQIAAFHQRRQIYAWYLTQGGEPIQMKDPQPLQSETPRY
jgi:hypothetical protein